MFARTKRLMLRPGWPEDAPQLAAAIAHEKVARNLARVPWPYDIGHAAAFLAVPRTAVTPRFLVFESPAHVPRLIGGIGIQPSVRSGEHELGYWFTPDVWGRGYATEAGRQVVAIARHALRLRRLHAFHFVDNPASGRVLAKLGFRATGEMEPRYSLARGGTAPALLLKLDLEGARATAELLAA